MAKATVQDTHLHIPNRTVLLFLLGLAVLVMFWVLFTRGLLTGSRASMGSNCRKTTFRGKCVMECKQHGETFTLPCPASSSSSSQQAALDAAATPTVTPKPSKTPDEKDPPESGKDCTYEEKDCRCRKNCYYDMDENGKKVKICDTICDTCSVRVCN